MNSPSPFRTKRQIATETLRHAIRMGRYAPGEALRQNELAAELGLSSTPVREALSELATDGLVVHREHRGNEVAALDGERVAQIYTARRIIETETARLAFARDDGDMLDDLKARLAEMAEAAASGDDDSLVRADEAFHLRLYEAADNPYLLAAIRTLWNSFPRYFLWTIEDRIARSAEEHRAIVTALETRDEAAFLTAVAAHLDNSLDTISRHLEKAEDERTRP